MKTIVQRLAEFGLCAALLGAVLALGPVAEAQKGGTKPPTPTGLTAAAGQLKVTLSWNVSSGATSYKVKRSTVSGKNFAVIASPTTTGYIDSNVVGGTKYYYVVSAVNAYGESANSTQVSATPQAAVFDPAIAFSSGGFLKAINADGQCPTLLTSYTVGRPAFSPNGQRIAFLAGSGAPQGMGLYVMNKDGSGLYKVRPINQFFVSGGYAYNAQVDWALMPDGVERIAYTDVQPNDGDYSVMLTDLAGTELRVVGPCSSVNGACMSPSFSGDGSTIFYTTISGDNSFWSGDIVGVHYSTLGGLLIEQSRTNCVYGVAVSPFFLESQGGDPWLFDSVSASRTGNKLVVEASRSSSLVSDIFVIDLDDPTYRLQLTNSPTVQDEFPAFSPDGSKVAFSTVIGSSRVIATIPAAGGTATSLSSTGNQPAWRRQP
ncbi:MAG: PD40 domain-containing protein [Armatimonadetes bacterium]|nr:PD40 domain-containing protein [Armatimonadota bacterium]